jgi:hypothetical protein
MSATETFKIIGPTDATWEKCSVMQQQFSQVVLEDKDFLRRVECYDMDVLGIRKYGRIRVVSLGLLSICN